MNNYNNLCRCCLNEGQLKNVFELQDNINISELMKQFLSIDVSIDNSLPTKICGKCSDLLRDFNKFKLQSEINECYLLEQIKEIHTDNTDQLNDELIDNIEDFNNKQIKRIKWKEQKPPFICNLCNKEYATYRKLYKHNMNHKARTIKCNICSYVCSKSYMIIHIRKHSGEKPFACNVCGLRFSKRTNLKRHTELHSDCNAYQCEICGREFKTKINLKIHVNLHQGLCIHNLNKGSCEKCLNKPKITSIKQLCNYCGKIFTSKFSLQAHIENTCKEANILCEHNIRKPSCELCKESKPYKLDVICCYCGKTFSSKLSLNVHIENTCRLSNRDRSITHNCDICNRTYPTLYNLNKHKRVIHSGKIFECHLCDKKYTLKSTLQEHISDHSTEHKCVKCDKTFTNIRSLKRHQLIHLNLKPFVCGICNKAFRAKEHLNAHMVTHTGEKNFGCAVCKKRFSLKATLNTHLRRVHNYDHNNLINWDKIKNDDVVKHVVYSIDDAL